MRIKEDHRSGNDYYDGPGDNEESRDYDSSSDNDAGSKNRSANNGTDYNGSAGNNDGGPRDHNFRTYNNSAT